jgi:hypothetical protein
LVNGKDIPLVAIPQFSYYGRRFFIDNLDFGFTLAERGANTFNLIATPGYDRVYFYRSDLQNFFIGFPNTSPVDESSGTPGVTKVPPPAPRITYLAGHRMAWGRSDGCTVPAGRSAHFRCLVRNIAPKGIKAIHAFCGINTLASLFLTI